MTTIVFIHGINVRDADFQQTLEVVRGKLAQHLPGAHLIPCQWGEDLGASLHCEGRSIPTYDTSKDSVSVLPEIEAATLWATLYDDPLFELRLVAHLQSSVDSVAPPQTLAGADDWRSLLDKIDRELAVIDRAAKNALLPYLDAAIATLRASDELDEALINFDASSDELPSVAARAISADMMRRAIYDGAPAIQGEERDALVAEIEDVLGGAAKGVGAWLAAPLVGLARNLATRYLRRHRHSLSNLASPVIGDLIVYQGRGEPIRNRIAEVLRRAEEPAVVIAHSLGGVAVVDTLLLDPSLRPRVRQLVTVGSQAGFFYEINGLVGMPYAKDAMLPRSFPPWLNFYDKADMLSYLVNPVLCTSAIDVEVQSNQPFPQSHSAYWTSTPLWDCVARTVSN